MGDDELTTEQAALVFRRAAELDGGQDAHRPATLELAAVEQAGIEAGLSPAALRQAIAEVRAGALVPLGPGGTRPPRLGPRRLTVARTVPGPPAAVEARLARFLQRECLRVRRRLPGRTVWERDPGLLATVRRGTDLNRRLCLTQATVVEAAVAGGAGDDRVVVRLTVTLRGLRGRWRRVAGLGVAGGAALAAGGIVAAVNGEPTGLYLLPAAGSLGGGALAGARRAYTRVVTHTADGLERFLDDLEGRNG